MNDGLTQETLAVILGLNRKDVQNLLRTRYICPDLQDTVTTFLRAKAIKEGINPEDLPAFSLPQNLAPSDFPLGRAKSGERLGQEIGFSQQDLKGHIGIFGISGVGKTTLIKMFILEFSGKKI